MTNKKLRIHQILPRSQANGPGERSVIWVQGCSLGCEGCFNPETHPQSPAKSVSVDDLFEQILELGDGIEGITLTGGEPLQQKEAITYFLARLKAETSLSTLVFTGFTWDEVQQMGKGQEPPEFIRYIDVLIAGRYDQKQRIANKLVGSANKTLHFFTNRYSKIDLDIIPPAEVIITPDGEVIMSGIDPVQW